MKIRNLLVGFVLAMMVLFASVTVNESKASAAPRCGNVPVKVYYTDATYTVVCGEYNFCYGSQDGCVTPYIKTIRRLCCD
jgi:hypothetical protein